MNTTCPRCGYKATEHSRIKEDMEVPANGDLSFCIKCGGFNEFFNGALQKVDIESLPKESQIELRDIETAWLKTKWQRDNL